MLRIMVIDDEETIRMGVVRIVSRASDGFKVVGSFSNGEEALREVSRLEPDVVLTDIRMPYMDGLRFIGELKEKRPHVRCLILSGFNDFEYARQAIQYGVEDYLIKPVDKQELIRNLTRIESELSEERAKLEREMELSLRADLGAQLEREAELRALLLGEGEADGREGAAVLVVRAESYAVMEAVKTAMRSRRSQPQAAQGAVMGDRVAAFLMDACADVAGKSDRERALSLFGAEPEGRIATGVSLPIGGGAESPQEAFSQALRASYAGFYGEVDSELAGAAAQEPGEAIQRLLDREIAPAFTRGDKGQALAETGRFYEEIRRVRLPYDEVVHLTANLFYSACMRIEGLSEESAALGGRQGFNIYAAASGKFTLGELREWFVGFLEEAWTRAEAKRQGTGQAANKQAIDAVKTTLQRNYVKDVELGELSEQVFLNASYLSSLFKQETGQTITQYVLQLRMTKATELLRSRLDLKVYEIAEMVGYTDAMYFNKLFKKATGFTPKEYRNQ